MFGFSRANIFLGNKDDSSNKDIFGVSNSSTTKKYSYDGSGKSSGNADTETVNLENTEEMNTSNEKKNYDDSKYVSEEDISDLIGTMSEKEYQEFIQGINDYYDQNIEQCNDYIKVIDETLNELNNQLVKDSYSGYVRCDEECKQELIGLLRTFVDAKEYEGTGVTLEQIQNMTDDERIAYILKHSEEAKAIKQKWDSAKTEHENVLKEQLKDLKIKTFDEYQKNIDTLKAAKANLQTQIENLNNNKKSSYYDNLQFLKDYSEYKAHVATQAEIEYVKGKAVHELDYEDFSKKFPGVSKLDFLKIVHEEMPTYWGEAMPGIYAKEMSKLKTIILASKKIPALEKTYNYLYSIDPKKADQFLQDAAYEINNIDGQIQAAAYLEKFHLEDGQANLSEFLFNEFGITLAGLTDGLNSFGDGCGYSMEALATILGITEENREMTAEEYKKMYIVYMLLDEETKLNAGLIKKNKDGTIENSDPLSFIDYTKTYKGEIVLKGSYNISQGIGNMLPSVALSTVCPIAGSVTLGVSAGGNSYHEAMINGESLLSSTMYGVFNGCSEAITERLLGGLPGLSDVEVTSLKTYLMAMGREGFEESFQGVMDSIYKGTFMGEGFPTTNAEFEEFIKDIGIQGFYGAITAGIMQSPSLASIMTTKIKYNEIMNQNNISKADQKAAIKYLKDTDTTGTFKDMKDSDIKALYGSQLLQTALNIRSPEAYNSSVFRENLSEKQRNEYNNLIQNFNLEKNPFFYYAKLLNNIDLNDSNNYVKALAVFDVYSDELGNINDEFFDKSLIFKDFLENANELYSKNIISETDLDFYKARVESVRNNYINKYYNFIEDAINKNSLYNAKFDSKNKTYTMLGLEPNSVYEFNFETSFGSKFSINFVTDESSNPKVLGVYDGLDLDSELKLLHDLVGYSEQGELQLVSTAKISNVNEKCKYNNNNPNVAGLSFMNSFGLNQGVFTNFDNLELSKSNFRKAYEFLLSNKGISMNKIYKNVFDIVRRYKPGISDGDIARYIKKINSTGACSYAAVLNDIIMQYNGKESDFKQIFGYDLYEKDFFGNKRLNSECLLVDFYTFVNMTNRSLFDDNSTYLDPESHDGQYYVTNSTDGVKTDIIQDFLNYKISNCDSKEAINNYDGYSIKIKRSEYIDYLSDYDENTPKRSIYDSITAGMDNGEHFTIGINVDHYSGNELKMYKYNNDSGKFDISYSTTSWIDNSSDLEGGLGNDRYDGHAMAIVAIDINGLYVESWGAPYFIPYTSLNKIKYNISGFKIELQKGD